MRDCVVDAHQVVGERMDLFDGEAYHLNKNNGTAPLSLSRDHERGKSSSQLAADKEVDTRA